MSYTSRTPSPSSVTSDSSGSHTCSDSSAFAHSSSPRSDTRSNSRSHSRSRSRSRSLSPTPSEIHHLNLLTPLIIDTNPPQFTQKFQDILSYIFNTYATNGYITTQNMQQFGRTCNNGIEFSEEALQVLRDNCDCREEDGAISEEGFLQMYMMQTLAEPEETYNDLRNHGYDENLDKIAIGVADVNLKLQETILDDGVVALGQKPDLSAR